MDSKKKLSFDTYGKTVKSLRDKIEYKDEQIKQSFEDINDMIFEYTDIWYESINDKK